MKESQCQKIIKIYQNLHTGIFLINLLCTSTRHQYPIVKTENMFVIPNQNLRNLEHPEPFPANSEDPLLTLDFVEPPPGMYIYQKILYIHLRTFWEQDKKILVYLHSPIPMCQMCDRFSCIPLKIWYWSWKVISGKIQENKEEIWRDRRDTNSRTPAWQTGG